MITQEINTFWANIYVGLKEGYDGPIHTKMEAQKILQDYCNAVGFGVTLTENTFIYCHGNEPGVIVGLINYPRFPSTVDGLKMHAMIVAERLRSVFKQLHVTVIFPDKTIMIGGAS